MAEFASALSPQELAGQQPDIIGNYAKGQQTVVNNQNIATGQRTAAAAAALPAALSAYNAGDESAIAQIAQANPEEAQALLNMKKTQQEAPLLGAQAANLQAETAQKKIETQKMIQDVHLQGLQKEGAYAQNLSTALAGIEDPTQKAKIWAQYAKDAKSQGIDVHPELSNWSLENEGHLKTISAMGQQAGVIRQLMNPTPEQQEFNYVKNLSPEDQQKYLAVKSGSPMMMGMGGGATGGAATAPPALPPIQGPTQNGQPVQAPAAAPGQPPALSPEDQADQARGLHPEVLHAMPPQIASQVKALAEGRMQFPSGFALKSAYWQQMLGAVSQYDPTFDAVNYNARAKVRADFTSGKTRQNLNSIETALNTLAQTKDASDALGGISGGGIANSLLNKAGTAIKGMENKPELNTYNSLAKTAADEVTKAVTGAAGGVEDRAKRLEQYTAAQSPDSRNAALVAAVKELNSRLDPIASAYNQGMGTDKNGIELLSPKAQAAYKKLIGEEADNARVSGVQPPPPNTNTGIKPPAGIDQNIWAHMTPEEQKLFVKK